MVAVGRAGLRLSVSSPWNSDASLVPRSEICWEIETETDAQTEKQGEEEK